MITCESHDLDIQYSSGWEMRVVGAGGAEDHEIIRNSQASWGVGLRHPAVGGIDT